MFKDHHLKIDCLTFYFTFVNDLETIARICQLCFWNLDALTVYQKIIKVTNFQWIAVGYQSQIVVVHIQCYVFLWVRAMHSDLQPLTLSDYSNKKILSDKYDMLRHSTPTSTLCRHKFGRKSVTGNNRWINQCNIRYKKLYYSLHTVRK